MTVEVVSGDGPEIGLADFVDALADARFDAECEESYLAMAPHLAALSRNRRFLGDRLIAELKERAAGQERDNGYGAQVLLLHGGPGWFVRANIWPDAHDPLLRLSGADRFFYGVPHNHNFCFLTAGHFGPGYWSDYYAFDPEQTCAVPGEPAGLRFVERSRLAEGRMLLYRAGTDVHSQHLPDSMSVSLNIVQGTAGRAFLDQFRFDLDRDLIAGQLAHTSTEALIGLLPALGGGEGADLLEHVSHHHPSDRIRFGAISARADATDAPEARAILAKACDDPSRTVAGLARRALAGLIAA